jgi:hypothetical protein
MQARVKSITHMYGCKSTNKDSIPTPFEVTSRAHTYGTHSVLFHSLNNLQIQILPLLNLFHSLNSVSNMDNNMYNSLSNEYSRNLGIGEGIPDLRRTDRDSSVAPEAAAAPPQRAVQPVLQAQAPSSCCSGAPDAGTTDGRGSQGSRRRLDLSSPNGHRAPGAEWRHRVRRRRPG